MIPTVKTKKAKICGLTPDKSTFYFDSKKALEGIEFNVTYKVAGVINISGVTELNNLDKLEPDVQFMANPKFELDKISPNRIIFECPTDKCDLRWVHKVLVDDPAQIPKVCVYCKRKTGNAVPLVRGKIYTL